MTNTSTQRGFSFVELVVSITVLAIAVVAITTVYVNTVVGSADPLVRAQATAVAESYMEEILAKHFDDPDGSDVEASRATYDDVDDFIGLSEEPQLPDGTLLGLSDYTVTVTITASDLGSITAGSGASLRIDVTVTHSSGQVVTMTGYRTDYGA